MKTILLGLFIEGIMYSFFSIYQKSFNFYNWMDEGGRVLFLACSLILLAVLSISNYLEDEDRDKDKKDIDLYKK